MYLENLNPAKKNTKVSVNGHSYWIGHGGFIADDSMEAVDVPQEDAEKLLQGKAWQKLSWDPKDPDNARRVATPGKPYTGAVGRPPRDMTALQWDKKVEPKTVEELGPQEISAGKAKVMEERAPTDRELAKSAKKDIEEAKKDAKRQDVSLVDQDVAEDSEFDPQEDEGLVVQSVEDTESVRVEDESVEGADEYPDPTEEMSLEYLKEMADAYEVSYTHRTQKARLVKDITEAMYPDEE